MPKDPTRRTDMLPGTLDLMILQVLSRGPMHGYGIAQRIEELTDEVLQVEEGSLYPALQRLRLNGWLAAEWKESARGRRARFYRLTAAGRKQLGIELGQFERLVAAVGRVIKFA